MEKPKIQLDDDWRHEFYALDALDKVEVEWQDLVRVWDGKRNGRMMPSWSNFEMFDFKPWLGFISVSKITLDPLDTRMTLWGTALTEIHGEDRTGRVLSASQIDWAITMKDWKFLERVVTTPCIGKAEGGLYWKDRDHVRLSRLFLPFAEDGTTCDTMMSAAKRR